MPEERVRAMQDFTQGGGAVLAILPRQAFGRLRGCLPQMMAMKR
jgi:hypothetical protein